MRSKLLLFYLRVFGGFFGFVLLVFLGGGVKGWGGGGGWNRIITGNVHDYMDIQKDNSSYIYMYYADHKVYESRSLYSGEK